MGPLPVTGPTTSDEAVRVRRLVSRYRLRSKAERLRLYRQHLQVTVTAATPLLAVITQDQGLNIRAGLRRLRPPFGWPILARPGSWSSTVHGLRHASHFGFGDADGLDFYRSVVLRDHQNPLGPLTLTLRLDGDAVEITAWLGNVLVKTAQGTVDIVLSFHLPDTIEEALVGRPVCSLIDHPWFTNTLWTIARINRIKRGSLTRTKVTVETGIDPFAMPWRRLLARL